MPQTVSFLLKRSGCAQNKRSQVYSDSPFHQPSRSPADSRQTARSPGQSRGLGQEERELGQTHMGRKHHDLFLVNWVRDIGLMQRDTAFICSKKKISFLLQMKLNEPSVLVRPVFVNISPAWHEIWVTVHFPSDAAFTEDRPTIPPPPETQQTRLQTQNRLLLLVFNLMCGGCQSSSDVHTSLICAEGHEAAAGLDAVALRREGTSSSHVCNPALRRNTEYREISGS